MEVAIIIILAVAVLMLVWGVSATARKLRLFEQKCKDQDEELTKLRWENSELQQKIEEKETELRKLKESSSRAKYPAHGGYFGH